MVYLIIVLNVFFNSLGEVIHTQQLDLAGDTKGQVQMPFAKPGLYFLKMHTNTGIYTTKLMIK